MAAPEPLNAITLNIINLTFLLVGILLHRTPARLMRAVQEATPAVWGVILQFPFYAGIAGIITGTHLSEQLASAFVQISTPTTFPAVVAVYSAVLGVFVPSGGSKWVIEAPYVMEAAHSLKVHLGWVVAAYDLGEALANLVQPFWMLPILGHLPPRRARRHGLHARRLPRARPDRPAPRHAAREDVGLSAVGCWVPSLQGAGRLRHRVLGAFGCRVLGAFGCRCWRLRPRSAGTREPQRAAP